MPLTLSGSFGDIRFRTPDGNTTQFVEFTTESTVTLISDIALKKSSIAANELGLYSLASVGRNGRVRWAKLSTPRHSFQPLGTVCAWNPKGRMVMTVEEHDLCWIELNMEQCNDIAIDNCLEEAFVGVGNEVRDMTATPEGVGLLNAMLDRIFLGMGNDYFNLAWWSNHPQIDDSETNGWYLNGTESETEWEDFKDQMSLDCSGWITTIDALKATGLEHYNVEIPQADVSGEEYNGTATDLFRLMRNSATSKFRTMLKARGRTTPCLILVSRGIYDAYYDELVTTYTAIPQGFELEVNGLGVLDGVLKWQGCWVICMDEWTCFDDIVGVDNHRAVMAAPGVLGHAYDVPDLRDQEGFGLRITRRLAPPYNGKTYMDTAFRTQSVVVDSDFLVNANIAVAKPPKVV